MQFKAFMRLVAATRSQIQNKTIIFLKCWISSVEIVDIIYVLF